MVYWKLSEKKERKRGQDEIQKSAERLGTIPRSSPRSSRWGGSPGEAVHRGRAGEDIGLLKDTRRRETGDPKSPDRRPRVTLEHELRSIATVAGSGRRTWGGDDRGVVRTVGR